MSQQLAPILGVAASSIHTSLDQAVYQSHHRSGEWTCGICASSYKDHAATAACQAGCRSRALEQHEGLVSNVSKEKLLEVVRMLDQLRGSQGPSMLLALAK